MMRRLPVMLSVCAFAGLTACTGTGDRDRYPVFFEPASTTISPTAQSIIDKAASDARASHAKVVEVIGHAGARGNLSTDEMLSVERAKVVAAALTKSGVDGAQITQIARPPKNNEDARVASRVVTIEIDPSTP
ncbi:MULTISPECIES: OmpA family protein [unclassified Asaia]|uniref:OmpA family protein n=1 Tax=unclassified Asaia TaxID=2685023 RepID=UPI0013157ABC|nr:OmpA family protein [Asaia sp. W19]